MKKTVCVLLTLLLLCGLLPAMAAEAPEDILTAGGYVTLEEDLTLTADVTLEKDTVLDLNGHTVTGNGTELTIGEGATVSIKSGTLADVRINNYGTVPLLWDLDIRVTEGHGLINDGVMGRVQNCTLYGKLNGFLNCGDVELIDNCDFTAGTFSGLCNSSYLSPLDADRKSTIALVRHCRLVGLGDRGSGFSGGEPVNGDSVLEDCLILSCGRGMGAYGNPITLRNCTIINSSTEEVAVSDRIAVNPYWLMEGMGSAIPLLENCTLVAMDSPCGRYEFVETDVEKHHGKWHYTGDVALNGTYTFIPLTQGMDLSAYTAWTMDPLPEEPEFTLPAEPEAEPAGSLANFAAVNTYTPGMYADVPETFWGAANVARAYELGLMKGTDAGFDPNGNVTLAQAVTMAARLHSIYTTGTEDFAQGQIWYQVYVDYALEKGILTGTYGDWNGDATRAQFAAILAAALPPEALEAVNAVADGAVPDVSMEDEAAEAIYRLYRAGILTGNDEKGTFTPEAGITRAAAAAILTRRADPALRTPVTLG